MRGKISVFIAAFAVMGLGLGVMAEDASKAGAPAAPAVQAASSENSQGVTKKGEIVDLTCYLDHGAKGAKHKRCALDCIKSGSPMGLLTDDGKVFLLVEDHKKKEAYASLKKMAGDQVTVTGDWHSSNGIQAIEVEKASKS